MKFKQNQSVHIIGTPYRGRVAGFCHYTRPEEVCDTAKVNEGVIVNLEEGFYDPTEKTFISMMVVCEDLLD